MAKPKGSANKNTTFVIPRVQGKANRRPFTKSTAATVQQRVDEIYQLLLQGSSRKDIQQYAAKHEWGLAPRTIDHYTARARKLFENDATYERRQELGKAIARLTHLYMRNMMIQDFKAALATQKELNTLLSLYDPQTFMLTLSPDALQALQKLGLPADEAIKQFEAVILEKAKENHSK